VLAEAIKSCLVGLGMKIVEELIDSARAPAFSFVHKAYDKGSALAYREAKLGPGAKVWSHQAAALDYLARGSNVITSTPTASGKSMIFQLHALKTIDDGGTVIVLYPLKALASDQFISWKKAVAAAGLPPETIAEITGDTPRNERIALLEAAKVILMTPDAMHAWLMGSAGNPVVRRFISRCRLLVLDECHVYDSVLGSSSALLFRRLIALSAIIKRQDAASAGSSKGASASGTLQVAASSATIPDPAKHMQALTGLRFKSVDEQEDGSPRHQRSILHVAGTSSNSMETMGVVMKALIAQSPSPLILFCDSRVMVERVSRLVKSDAVLPYRQGYEQTDRKAIEERLRAGKLRAVVSTSALEMGIDIPLLQVGVNMDAMASRRSMRQRIGRVGRAGDSVFIIIAPQEQFAQFGETFTDYVRGPVEPTSLYTENRYIQYQHARCLGKELSAINEPMDAYLEEPITWPKGFDDLMERIRDPMLHQEFDDLNSLVIRNYGNPHIAFGLRSVGEATYEIRTDEGRRIGSIAHSNGMKEAYPEGLYTHMKQNYRVAQWKQHPAPTIIVRPYNGEYTTPLQRTSVNAQIDEGGILNERFIGDRNQFITECAIVVKLSTFGLKVRNIETLYPRPEIIYRTIATSGVIMTLPQIPDADYRQIIADELITRFRRQKNIAHSDVDFTVAPIGLREKGLMHINHHAITIYDSQRGSLRLTEGLYETMPLLVRQIVKNGSVSGRQIPSDLISRFEDWWRSLADAESTPPRPVTAGPLMVIPTNAPVRPASRQNELHRVIEPLMIMENGQRQLFYVCRSEYGHMETIPSDVLMASGVNLVPWDPLGMPAKGRISRVDYEL
jgi:DEAD/DEAH box helicase domain-containing protein